MSRGSVQETYFEIRGKKITLKCLSERHVNLVVELSDTSENMQE